MPYYNTEESIQHVVTLLNKRLYNAGYSFRVIEVSEYTVYVQASFDFGYYVNVHIQFDNCIFTNLKERDEWPDAWHADQLFLLDEVEVENILNWYDVEKKPTNNLFAFIFNINGCNINNAGVVVCEKLYIRWEHPYYD